MIVFAENPEKLLGNRSSFVPTSRVGHGLTAAGLLFGKIDIQAELSQHSECRQSYVWVELIDVARNKETYLRHTAPQAESLRIPRTQSVAPFQEPLCAHIRGEFSNSTLYFCDFSPDYASQR